MEATCSPRKPDTHGIFAENEAENGNVQDGGLTPNI